MSVKQHFGSPLCCSKYLAANNTTYHLHDAQPTPPLRAIIIIIIFINRYKNIYRRKVLDKAFAYNANRCQNKPLNLLPNFLFILWLWLWLIACYMCVRTHIAQKLFYLSFSNQTSHLYKCIRMPCISRLKLSKFRDSEHFDIMMIAIIAVCGCVSVCVDMDVNVDVTMSMYHIFVSFSLYCVLVQPSAIRYKKSSTTIWQRAYQHCHIKYGTLKLLGYFSFSLPFSSYKNTMHLQTCR